jgi:hypothetical protein
VGNHKTRHEAKVRNQLISKQENVNYYQNSSNQKSPRSDRERTEDRKIEAK